MRPGTVICLLAGGEGAGGGQTLGSPPFRNKAIVLHYSWRGFKGGLQTEEQVHFHTCFPSSTAPTVLTASQSSLHEDSAQSDARLLPQATPPIGRVVCQFTAIAKQATNNKNSNLQMRSTKNRKKSPTPNYFGRDREVC